MPASSTARYVKSATAASRLVDSSTGVRKPPRLASTAIARAFEPAPAEVLAVPRVDAPRRDRRRRSRRRGPRRLCEHGRRRRLGRRRHGPWLAHRRWRLRPGLGRGYGREAAARQLAQLGGGELQGEDASFQLAQPTAARHTEEESGEGNAEDEQCEREKETVHVLQP